MKNQSTPIINHYVALVKLSRMTNSLSFVEDIAKEITQKLGLKVVNKTSHIFYPQGVTLALLLSQSHLVIHTWPEFSTVHVDLVTCSSSEKSEFEKAVKSVFSAGEITEMSIKSVDFDNH